MAETRELTVAKALSVAVELLGAEESKWWRRWDAKDEDDYCQGKAEEYAALAQVLRENRSTFLATLFTPQEPGVMGKVRGVLRSDTGPDVVEVFVEDAPKYQPVERVRIVRGPTATPTDSEGDD